MTTSVRIEQPVVKEIRDLFGSGNASVEVEYTDGTVVVDSLYGLLVHTGDLLERLTAVERRRVATPMYDGPVAQILPAEIVAGQTVWTEHGWIVAERAAGRDVWGDIPIYDGDAVVYLPADEKVTVQVSECEGSSMQVDVLDEEGVSIATLEVPR